MTEALLFLVAAAVSTGSLVAGIHIGWRTKQGLSPVATPQFGSRVLSRTDEDEYELEQKKGGADGQG